MTIKGEAKRLESSFSSINLSFSLRLRYPLRIHPIIHPIIHHPDTKMETSELGHEEEEEQQVTKQEDEGEGEEVVISNEMEASAGNSSLAARSDREVLVARSALSSRPGNKNQTKSALIRSKSAPIRSRNTMLLRNSPTGCVMSIGREEASALCSGDSLVNEVRDFKKISQGRRRQGSALHRNSQRSQRLMSLNTKEKIRRLLVNQFERKGKESRDLEEGGASGSELAILKETEPFLYYQVKNEDSRKRDSAKLIEINKLIEPYCVASGQSLHAQKFPLEVRLQKVTYTVADETSAAAQGSSPQQIQTVFNTSVFYSAYTWLRRLVRCQETTSNKTVQVPRKSVLEDINLVIQPGKHYLLLGPPGSGKSTLLKTIAGLIRHDEDDDVGKMSAGNIHASLQGEILYNGRSLKVRIVLCVTE
jgi:flagellar biosynthesis GTPase FlhF